MLFEEVLITVTEYKACTRLSGLLRFVEPNEKRTGNATRSISVKNHMKLIDLFASGMRSQTKTGTGNTKSNNNTTAAADSSAEDDSDDEEEQKEAHDEVSYLILSLAQRQSILFMSNFFLANGLFSSKHFDTTVERLKRLFYSGISVMRHIQIRHTNLSLVSNPITILRNFFVLFSNND